MKVIGITGGVGSGKSKVASYLEREYKAYVCRLDDVAKKLQKKGEACYDPIVEQFGREILGKDGELDREGLSKIVFCNEEKRKLLNELVHPFVRRQVEEDIKKKRKAGIALYVIEAALLPEAGYKDICTQMWYIYAKEDVRRKRLKKSRGYSDERVSRMIASQPLEKTYRDFCGVVIDNSGEFEKTIRQIGEQL